MEFHMHTIDGIEVLPENGNAPSLYAIGWGLARTPRFAGQTKTWYPVLAHTFAVADLVREQYRAEALLHDAAECVLGDQVATWKNPSTSYDEICILKTIYSDNEIVYDSPFASVESGIKVADLVVRAAEANILGHSVPNAKFFTENSDKFPDLYEKALEITRLYVGIYTHSHCIGNTDACAKQYVSEVNMAIDYQKVNV